MIKHFNIEDLPLEAAVDRYREPWEAWVVEHGLNISHLPDWLLCAARGLDVMGEVQISVAHGPDGPAGFVPWSLRRKTLGGVPYHALEIGACLPAYHPDWLTGPAGLALLRHLKMRILGVHAVCFSNIPDKGATTSLLSETEVFACRHVGSGETSPVIKMPKDWQAYMKTKSRNFRYNLRRKKKKFANNPDSRTEWLDTAEDVPRLLEAMLEIEAESWKMPAGIAIERSSSEHRYYQHLLPWLASRGAMAGIVLWEGEEPAAYALRYLWQGEMGNIKSTYKTKYGHLSPGTILQEQSMHYAFDRGMRLFDFLGDTGRHKEEWANDAIEHRSDICFVAPWRYRLGQASHRITRVLKSLRERMGTPAA